jgi:Spy/CpxP family protein refolding chaperone
LSSEWGSAFVLALALLPVESGGMSSEPLILAPTNHKEREMQRSVFATLALASALVVSSNSIFAQTPQTNPGGAAAPPQAATEQDIQLLREDIRAHRKQLTASNMTLTPDEATKFWPIYDQYIQETIKINDDRWALIKDYAANYNSLTDQHAQDYVKRSVDIDQQLTALRAKYVSIFQRIVSPKKSAQWYQIDHRIDLLINLQLAALIPIADSTK